MGMRDKIAKALMGAIGGPNKLGAGGIDVYHSSPHTFDKFDLGKIGSGEGAQVYGHGLYFAENPKVSGQGGQYWDQFMSRMPPDEQAAAGVLRNEKFDRQKAIEYSQWNLDQLRQGAEKGELNPHMMKLFEARQRQHDLLMGGSPVGPRTYEANIKADPAQMLDWDKALKDLPQGTRENLYNSLDEKAFRNMPAISSYRRALEGEPTEWGRASFEPTGEGLYSAMRGSSLDKNAPRAVSEALRMNSVPGIKYLDEGSRNARPVLKTDSAGNAISSEYAPPTSNYVVFDPASIDIRKMYAAPVVAAPVLGAIGDESKYEVQP